MNIHEQSPCPWPHAADWMGTCASHLLWSPVRNKRTLHSVTCKPQEVCIFYQMRVPMAWSVFTSKIGKYTESWFRVKHFKEKKKKKKKREKKKPWKPKKFLPCQSVMECEQTKSHEMLVFFNTKARIPHWGRSDTLQRQLTKQGSDHSNIVGVITFSLTRFGTSEQENISS